MAVLINRAVIITMAMVILCRRAIIQIHVSTTRLNSGAVADLFRENGWKVLHQPREQNSAPDLIASRPGKKLIIEIKRASEGRRDRVIALLSQAALEAAYYSRNFAGNPIPVAIVGANHISEFGFGRGQGIRTKACSRGRRRTIGF